MLHSRATEQEIRKYLKGKNHEDLRQEGLRVVEEGKSTLEEVLRVTRMETKASIRAERRRPRPPAPPPESAGAELVMVPTRRVGPAHLHAMRGRGGQNPPYGYGFSIQAIDPRGASVASTIEAASPQHAAEMLRERVGSSRGSIRSRRRAPRPPLTRPSGICPRRSGPGSARG